jgi:molecular chaperone GrpE (heat shock protein)
MADLGELKYKYAQLVEERDAFRANLESTKRDLLAAQALVVSDVEPCETYPHLESELEKLRKQCDEQVRDLERVSAELEGFRARPTLLGACKVCPTLREELA